MMLALGAQRAMLYLMKTVATEQNKWTGRWGVRIDGEWLRQPKMGGVRWFRTEKEALRAASKGVA